MDENCWPLILDAATGFTDQYDEPDGVVSKISVKCIYLLTSSPSRIELTSYLSPTP